MHSAPVLIVRLYLNRRVIGEVGYHGYATQRFGACVAPLRGYNAQDDISR